MIDDEQSMSSTPASSGSSLIRQDAEPHRDCAVVTEIEASKSAANTSSLTKHLTFAFTHAGTAYTFDIPYTDRWGDFLSRLEELTTVPIERMKILGLFRNTKVPKKDDIALDVLFDYPYVTKRFSLVGTPLGKEHKDRVSDIPDPAEEEDMSYGAKDQIAINLKTDPRTIQKLQEACDGLVMGQNLNIMNPPREGKALLVLDIDYTILDTKPLTNGQIPIDYCIRPFLHQFLEDVYPYYDIVIWSQTHWQWIDIKLSEMGMLQTDRKYKITFILDKGPMFLVYSKRNDELYKHHVKPLEVIWRKAIGKWDASNTVHIDDLSRNFALNTENGLKVKAFKDASQLGLQASRDRELLLLSRYLCHIAESGKDFRSFDFNNWKQDLRDI